MFMSVTASLAEGFLMTLKIFGLTLLFALPLGLIISFGSMSKVRIIKWIVKAFVWIIRGTPLMLQLIIIYYGPGLAGEWAKAMPAEEFNAIILPLRYIVAWVSSWSVFDRFIAVMIAFTINYACYFSEIFRGGIEGIPKGQYEAGYVLGMKKSQVFFKIVLPQVIKRIIPPMSNEIITLVKDTSLARVIAVYEVIWSAQVYIKRGGLIWPLFYTGVFYLLFSGILTLLFGWIEKKLDYYHS
ncbi:MAG: amino acid ABC transporter permease [Clostridia bacterium]|nr:amino acid ABC transporter permease [Clostridia bacterium]